MTVSALYEPVRVPISGSDYEFTFDVASATDLLVYTIDANDDATTLTNGVDYIVTLSEVSTGGSIETGSYVMSVWTPAAPSGVDIQIGRNTPRTQTTDIPVRGGFRESAIEGALDNIIRIVQEQEYKLDQAIDVDPTAIQDTVAAAQVAQTAAEAAQTAAEAAQAAAEAAATTAIDDALNTSTGHDHDGTDSKKVLVTNLDVTGITDGYFLKRSSSAIAGVEDPSKLKLISTTTMSAVDNSGDITITAGKLYKIVIEITALSSDDPIYMRIHNATSGYLNWQNHASTAATDDIPLTLAEAEVDSSYATMFSCEINMNLIAHGNSRARIRGTSIYGEVTNTPQIVDFHAEFQNASTTTSFEILTQGGPANMTGTIYLYEISQ